MPVCRQDNFENQHHILSAKKTDVWTRGAYVNEQQSNTTMPVVTHFITKWNGQDMKLQQGAPADECTSQISQTSFHTLTCCSVTLKQHHANIICSVL